MFEYIFFSHILGDYFLQMPLGNVAIEKRHNTKDCLKHVGIYTACQIPLVFYYSNLFLIPLFLIGFTHFLQDRYWFPFRYYEKKLLKLKNYDDINIKIWYPIMYVAIDNSWHLFCNYHIIKWF